MLPFRSSSRNSRRSRKSLEAHQQHENPNSLEWQPDRDQYIMSFPIHPLSSMQGPFEESILASTVEGGYVPFQNPNKSVEKRQEMICKDGEASELDWNFTYNCHWRHHARGKYHPLLMTIAQIVFGVHLLHQHLEKSVADVAEILLKHVNELDAFLQRANEDIEGSLKDMLFRRKCLKVPMEHVNEFDRLLDDRTYRAQLLDGNITIERTINRMSQMLNDYLVDMSTYRDANTELDMYLASIGNTWTSHNDDVARIYSAMCGNTAGWSQFLQSLVAKAEKLGVVLVQVSSYCHEIEKRCGAASRRSMIASRSSSRSTSSRDAGRSFRNFADNKPLPMVPNERPPFMPSSSMLGETRSGDSTPPRPGEVHQPRGRTGRIRTIEHSDSDDSLQREGGSRQLSAAISSQASSSDVTVLPRSHESQSSMSRDLSSSASDRQVTGSKEPTGEPYQASTRVLQRSEPQPSTMPLETLEAKRFVIHPAKDEQSPPLTGKDSAYSSVSGGSFASPTGLPPRSASAQSSHPRAQFGLFPSSGPSTPKLSSSGLHVAMSPPASTSRSRPAPAPAQDPAPRAQSAMEYRAPELPASKGLLRKSSLSSFKRLFSKKKQESVETIAE
ncbi:hypothetical protein BU24DRAFT_168225 [Aaosphaeria arxii CBS 175.79]|uniref:Uncharacterized protein n=1 Tax=Aaosphaeria arxii CBS 175.79 TaxID=1450172 RepID=A0A6A5XZS1_9PLEO|nr:uncharacterized protein BU24DRAFT_168225 [Aaosphaeria arxii CBS 175.79]KAF2018307.1 hypothetical protein BU24DRAFT_168225 [Aaosphaeria arxii CBS 175.79]